MSRSKCDVVPSSRIRRFFAEKAASNFFNRSSRNCFILVKSPLPLEEEDGFEAAGVGAKETEEKGLADAGGGARFTEANGLLLLLLPGVAIGVPPATDLYWNRGN